MAPARTLFVAAILLFSCGMALAADKPFGIRVVDDQTGRGIPLAEVKIVPDEFYITDSNGYVAISDITLMNQEVFFFIYSHGYEHAKDMFGYPGKAVKVTPGGAATFKMKRHNIAERLYRVTGIGIYRDTLMLGKSAPLKKPLINALVTGCDTVQTAVAGDTIYWFWGDTDRLAYPLGNFATTGARSKLPSAGGLDPMVGVDLEYFEKGDGFVAPMFPSQGGLATWVDGVFSVAGPDGSPKVVTHAELRKGLGDVVENKLSVFDPEKPGFDTLLVYTEKDKLWPRGQAFEVTENGQDYIYFATPYPLVRVRAEWDALKRVKEYEAFTPLQEGATIYVDQDNPPKGGTVAPYAKLDPKDWKLDVDANGKLKWGWKKNTAPLTRDDLQKLVEAKRATFEDNFFRTIDAQNGKEIILSAGSVHWNEHRQRYVLIGMQTYGDPSFLGEIWYAEATRPEGPFVKAVKIVSHYKYSFYNVLHHPYFDQDGGKKILFEGTYTTLFTENVQATPWYDYNQVMYSLDLTDPRLKAAFVQE